MQKKDDSFWSEIKSLDERLAQEPDSFCFARLSEIYLKVGLVADALHTARHGVDRHPGYLAGQRALAMACHVSGLHDECRSILEKLTAAMPDDVEAQKLLASLYVDAGDTAAAIRTYTTVLDFSPDDVQSKIQLENIQKITMPEQASLTDVAPVSVEEMDDEGEILELTESDIFYDDEQTSEEDELPEQQEQESGEPTASYDPLSTQTLADLYERQGFYAKALAIYRSILADDPYNAKIQAKIDQLEGQEFVAEPEGEIAEQIEEPALNDEPASIVPVASAAAFAGTTAVAAASLFGAHHTEESTVTNHESMGSAVIDDMPPPLVSSDFSPFASSQADNVVETLDGWLENIRRIKACR